MILVTVTNQNFAASTFNLIESYKYFSFDKHIVVYDFGLNKTSVDLLNKTYGDQISVKSVEPVCPHSHKPRTFFYKTFAIKGASELGEDFIYSDAANAFVAESTHLYEDVKKQGRLFLPYTAEGLTNKYWTTQKCFTKMGCDSPEYYNAPQYWAGFQAYLSNQNNKDFISEMYDYMLDPDIAEPDTTVSRPDGQGNPCIEHRQDQSVLSLLIKKWEWDQKYDETINNRYGDVSTFSDWENDFDYDLDSIVLSARFSKFGHCRYVKPEILQKL